MKKYIPYMSPPQNLKGKMQLVGKKNKAIKL